jgi:multiple antibiotic resistance protein
MFSEFWTVFSTNALKFFFLYTPFFALSMFLCITEEMEERERRRLSGRVMSAAFFVSLILLFLGQAIFSLFGITLDAFRVGVGTILLLSAIGLAKGKPVEAPPGSDDDIAIVPMAIPVVVGPATIGTILVLGTELTTPLAKAACVLSMAAACATIWVMLYLATSLERRFGRRIFAILSRITGLVLASLASQLILSGVSGFLKLANG